MAGRKHLVSNEVKMARVNEMPGTGRCDDRSDFVPKRPRHTRLPQSVRDLEIRPQGATKCAWRRWAQAVHGPGGTPGQIKNRGLEK